MFWLQIASETFALFHHTVLLDVYHCDVSQMRWRTPIGTKRIFIIWTASELKVRLCASKTGLSIPYTFPHPTPITTHTPNKVVFLLTVPMLFLCCSSLCVCVWCNMFLLFCLYMYMCKERLHKGNVRSERTIGGFIDVYSNSFIKNIKVHRVYAYEPCDAAKLKRSTGKRTLWHVLL